MEKKLFAFDVDGTLLDHKYNCVPQSALDAIKELKRQGHIVGVATGRNKRQFLKSMDAKGFDFIILCNGGYFEINGEKITDIQFPLKEKVYLCDLLDTLDYQYSITTEYQLYSKNPTHENVQEIIARYNVLTPEKIQDVRSLPVYQFSIYEKDLPIDIVKKIEKRFVIHSLGETGYDVVIPSINKGNMLKEVAKYFSIDMENTVAFGDGDNDRLFLKEAGIGVAMGNACERSKQSADFITTESYNNGIFNGIKKLGYL